MKLVCFAPFQTKAKLAQCLLSFQSKNSPSFQSEIRSSLQAKLIQFSLSLKAKRVAKSHSIRLASFVGLIKRFSCAFINNRSCYVFFCFKQTKTAVKLHTVILSDICTQANSKANKFRNQSKIQRKRGNLGKRTKKYEKFK